MSADWIATVDDFRALLQASEQHPVWLLKHSIHCDLSSRVYDVFMEHEASSRHPHLVLAVQDAPELSGVVEERLGVRHETPQVLLIEQRVVTWHASHRITMTALTAAERRQESRTSGVADE